jgi:Pyridine nucleotide-disulphide oxidoreductase, dimerisation domain
LVADARRGRLVGAWAVAPLAGEWIHYAALAIKTGTALEVLRDTVAQFPTFSEVNALTTAKEFKEAGDEAIVIFDGAGTKWVPELRARGPQVPRPVSPSRTGPWAASCA